MHVQEQLVAYPAGQTGEDQPLVKDRGVLHGGLEVTHDVLKQRRRDPRFRQELLDFGDAGSVVGLDLIKILDDIGDVSDHEGEGGCAKA